MTRKIGTYKTRNGNGLYTFGFRKEGGRVEVDIENSPSYGSRADNGHATHRLPSATATSGSKICFGDPDAVRTLKDAKKYAQGWAEATQDYIEKGKRF